MLSQHLNIMNTGHMFEHVKMLTQRRVAISWTLIGPMKNLVESSLSDKHHLHDLVVFYLKANPADTRR